MDQNTTPPAEAEAWACAQRGIALLEAAKRGQSASPEQAKAVLQESLVQFDRAIELRTGLLAGGDPYIRYNLAGAWMNRADVLRIFGGPENLTQSIVAQDKALEIMGEHAAGEDPVFQVRRAIAWLNRGSTLIAMGTEEHYQQAADSLKQAAEEADAAGGGPDTIPGQVCAAAWATRANALGRLDREEEGRASAHEALKRVQGAEQQHRQAAQAGLKARLSLWQWALAALQRWTPGTPDPVIDEAVDQSEEGLALLRSWQNDPEFALIGLDLFRMAAQTYARRQPRFLAEFIREQLPVVSVMTPAPARGIAIHALEGAANDLAQASIARVGSPDIAPMLEWIRDLRLTATALKSAPMPATAR